MRPTALKPHHLQDNSRRLRWVSSKTERNWRAAIRCAAARAEVSARRVLAGRMAVDSQHMHTLTAFGRALQRLLPGRAPAMPRIVSAATCIRRGQPRRAGYAFALCSTCASYHCRAQNRRVARRAAGGMLRRTGLFKPSHPPIQRRCCTPLAPIVPISPARPPRTLAGRRE